MPILYGDKYRLIQVFYNLVGNSIKFTEEAGFVTIFAYCDKETVCIGVKDTGIGIPEDMLEHIFQPFEQVEQGFSKNFDGLGLGLSISNDIITGHQGCITVESHIGNGSVFTVSLPASRNVEQLPRLDGNFFEIVDEGKMENWSQDNCVESKSLVIQGKLKTTIVVIDDYYGNVVSVASILKADGYTVKGYVDGVAGLDEIRLNPDVAAVILDLMMPGYSGIDICTEIRKDLTMLELPILMLTARTQMTSLVDSFKAGVNDFLFKPFEPEELRARVATLVELKNIEEKAIEHELGKLYAQINPHFISNAMIAVSECCYRDAEAASNMIMDLTDYIRFSFSYDHKIKEIELTKELELVRLYLEIEKMRFGDELTYRFEMEEEGKVKIPPFFLQTLVENAVRHGIRQKEGGGSLLIKGYREKAAYCLQIIDSGIGMSESDINLALLGQKSRGTGTGMAYVNKTLNSLYGTQLMIESQYGEGTQISMRIKERTVNRA